MAWEVSDWAGESRSVRGLKSNNIWCGTRVLGPCLVVHSLLLKLSWTVVGLCQEVHHPHLQYQYHSSEGKFVPGERGPALPNLNSPSCIPLRMLQRRLERTAFASETSALPAQSRLPIRRDMLHLQTTCLWLLCPRSCLRNLSRFVAKYGGDMWGHVKCLGCPSKS